MVFQKKLCKIWNKVTQLLAVGIVLYQFGFGFDRLTQGSWTKSLLKVQLFFIFKGFSDQLHLRSETLKMGVFTGQQVEVDYREVSCILLYTLGVFLSGFRSKIACGKGCLSHPGGLPNVLKFELTLFHVIQSIICQKHSITPDVGPFFHFSRPKSAIFTY